MTETCKIEGCDKSISARGWCSTHYSRWYHKGDPGTAELLHKHHSVSERMCTRCGELCPATKEYFSRDRQKRDGLSSECRACRKKVHQKIYAELRATVMEHYSNGVMVCECCGENQPEFLVLDHKNGDGAKHRAKVGRGPTYLRWIIKNDFPPIFRILCQNCNFSMGIYGYCPHEKEVVR